MKTGEVCMCVCERFPHGGGGHVPRIPGSDIFQCKNACYYTIWLSFFKLDDFLRLSST